MITACVSSGKPDRFGAALLRRTAAERARSVWHARGRTSPWSCRKFVAIRIPQRRCRGLCKSTHGRKRNTGLWAAGLTPGLSALVPAVVMGPLYADNPVYGEQADTQTHQIIHYTLMAPSSVRSSAESGCRWFPTIVAGPRPITRFPGSWPMVSRSSSSVTMLVAAQKTTYRLGPRRLQIVRSLQVAPLKSQDLSGIAVIGRF